MDDRAENRAGEPGGAVHCDAVGECRPDGVIFLGETISGMQLVALALHWQVSCWRRYQRSDRAFGRSALTCTTDQWAGSPPSTKPSQMWPPTPIPQPDGQS